MRIYRIEHSTGWNNEEHILDAEARERRLVFPPTMAAYQAFGCESLAKLRRWFPSPAGTKALEELDATLCAFDARDEDVIAAPSQILFNRLTATFLWNVPASMLHTLTDEDAAMMPRGDRVFLEPEISTIAPFGLIPAEAA